MQTKEISLFCISAKESRKNFKKINKWNVNYKKGKNKRKNV